MINLTDELETKDETKAPVKEETAGTPTPEASSRTDEFGRTVYSSTCSECGQAAEIPFKPTEGRPVYCRDCYGKRRKTRPER